MTDAAIFADLKQDHDKHREMLAQLGETSGDSDERRALFSAFRIEVTAHAAAEEMSLYATMLGRSDLRHEAQHSVSEHKEIEDFLEALGEIELSSPHWLPKFKEMRDRYEHHIDEEEEEMFPAAADGLSQAKQAELATIFEERKPQQKAVAAKAEA